MGQCFSLPLKQVLFKHNRVQPFPHYNSGNKAPKRRWMRRHANRIAPTSVGIHHKERETYHGQLLQGKFGAPGVAQKKMSNGKELPPRRDMLSLQSIPSMSWKEELNYALSSIKSSNLECFLTVSDRSKVSFFANTITPVSVFSLDSCSDSDLSTNSSKVDETISAELKLKEKLLQNSTKAKEIVSTAVIQEIASAEIEEILSSEIRKILSVEIQELVCNKKVSFTEVQQEVPSTTEVQEFVFTSTTPSPIQTSHYLDWISWMDLTASVLKTNYWIQEQIFCVKYQESISQSSLSPYGHSNACVLISLSTCLFFQYRILQTNPVISYIDAIEQGNRIYFNDVPRNRPDPNLYIEEAIYFSKLPVCVASEFPIFEFLTIAQYVQEKHEELVISANAVKTFVLILPPDKAMAVLMTKDEIAVLDSHHHPGYGALMLIAKVSQIELLFSVLEEMLLSAFRTKTFNGAWLYETEPLN